MGSSGAACTIAEVSLELVRVERLRGSVQTVFPIHACMPPTANNSETQDYGTVGSDGPIEGATKVFQVTLRDLGVPGNISNLNNHSLQHRINAYFYDKWAVEHHSLIGPGDEIEVSGPAARLVRPDPSASANGDHPFCLVFHNGNDDHLLAVDAVAADHLSGVAGGGGSSAVDDAVSCKVVRKAAQRGPGIGAGSRGGGAAVGRGGDRRGSVGKAKASYVYTTLDSISVKQEKTNVYGIVCSFTHRHQCRGRDMTNSLSLLDETCAESDSAVPCNFFNPTLKGLPVPLMVGDILRLHRAKVGEYRGRPQLVAGGGTAWLIIRKKQAVRETFLKVTTRGMGGGSGGGGDVDDEDPDPDDDSQPSGPDAGGGEADAVLPATEWEVQASSANYTLSQVDQDRCNALNAWLWSKSPHLWLKQSSEAKIWVQDIFRRPRSGPTISSTEVDLVCCLTSKRENAEGGAGSLSEIYVADGTGFASSMPGNEWDGRRDTALLKGVRMALGKPNWSPGNPRPPPVPAHLKIDILENNKEWEALALSPGMWIRLRRLTITKNRHTGNMSAKMTDKGSSVNPLHPSMAEVQHIAMSYATHCASANSSRNGSNNRTSGDGGRSNSEGTNTESGTESGRKQASVPFHSSSRSAPLSASAPAQVSAVASSTQMNPPRGTKASLSSGLGGIAPNPAGRGQAPTTTSDSGGIKLGPFGVVASRAVSVSVNGGRPITSLGVELKSPSSTVDWHRSSQVSAPAAASAAAGAAARKGPAALVQPAGPPLRHTSAGGQGVSFASAVHGGKSNSGGIGDGDGGTGAGSRESARGTKRALPVSEERDWTGARADAGTDAPGGELVFNLGVVRSTTAPKVFDTQARILSHWPAKVEDFVRKGPGGADGLRYLFTLRLEDDYGIVDAVVAGPDASSLLPGAPSPEEFHATPEVREKVERVLLDLEAAGADRAGGGVVHLRLRSYLAPRMEIGQRAEKCKRYSIIAPSCLRK